MNGAYKKAVQISPGQEKEIDELPIDRSVFIKGIGGKVIPEVIPMYISNERETILGNNKKVNAQIVLGADRPANRFTGYSGAGHTQASSIDIVVGRMSSSPKHVYVDPNFTTDAARIYISQKTDVDKNFKLGAGQVGYGAAKSAVALKADGIRLVAREGIKLVTGLDAKNSQGGTNASVMGIDLIAGNNDLDMQPFVKGENLRQALTEICTQIDNLNGIVDHMLTTQMNFNEAITHHYHFSPFFGNPTLPSDLVAAKGMKCMIDFLQDTKRSIINNKQNLVNFRNTYLEQWGEAYINSRWNHTN